MRASMALFWVGLVCVFVATGCATKMPSAVTEGDLAREAGHQAPGDDTSSNAGEPTYVPTQETPLTCRFIATPEAWAGFPKKLSDTRCVDAAHPSIPVDGFLAYEVNAPFFSDHATMERLVFVPEGKKIHIDEATGEWQVPVGAVLMKKFFVQGILTETRFFARHDDGTFGGYTYVWNIEHTDADLAPWQVATPPGTLPAITNPAPITVGGQAWTVPSAQCLSCHQFSAADATTRRPLGFTTAQLNRQSGDGLENQLLRFEALGFLDAPLSAAPETLPKRVDPYAAGPAAGGGATTPEAVLTDLQIRGKAYLSTNCSLCHAPGGRAAGGATAIPLDFRESTALSEMHMCDVASPKGPEGRIYFKPGAPADSLMLQRVAAGTMPPVATGHMRIDEDAVALLGAWITATTVCP
jgi:hypothetical protein